MINDFTKKEAPILSTLGLGGGNASRLFLSGAVVLGNRSLRFNDGDSAYLGRTPSSAGNRRTWTWSAWIKRSELASSNTYNALWSTGTDGNNYSTLYIDNNDRLFLQEYTDSTDFQFLVEPLLRDTAAWYHIVVSFDSTQSTATDRMKIYINGVQQDSTGTRVDPSQNYESMFNLTNGHSIGRNHAYNNFFFSGYITDVYFIDGSQLAPTSFGAADSNGVWQRSTYSGSYGTNGYHVLDFANDGTIGNDTSGQGNNYTANNFSETAGSGNDVLFDFPTNDTVNTDAGAGGEVIGNYCVFNFLNKGNDVTLSNGNLQAACTSSSKDGVFGTIGVSSGKYYWEVELTSADGNTNAAIGVALGTLSPDAGSPTSAGAYFYSSYNGNKWLSSADSSYGASYTTGDIIGVALDLDNTTLTFYKNGVSQGNATTSLPSGTYFPYVGDNANNSAQTVVANWGQRAFSYSAPSNFKCLTTTSLPTPGVADGSDYFDAKLWTGTGSSQAINTYSFSPDMAWIKVRNNAGSFALLDTIRGNSKVLRPDINASEQTNETVFSTFDSNGFTLGADTSNGWTNYNTWTYVGWAWEAGSSTVSNSDGNISSNVRASQTSGFSVVTYSGNDSTSGSVGHGLGKKPGMIIVKTTNDNRDWKVAHSSLSTTHMLTLNENYAAAAASWNGMNSSVFYPARSGDTYLNTNGRDYVAYCFAPIEGYSAVGVYSPNNSADGPYITTGFRPAFIMFKQSDSASQPWIIHDYKRNGFNKTDPYFITSGNNSEFSDNGIDILSNGWKIRNNNAAWNGSSGTYVWFAAAENPFQANGGLAR